MELRALRYFVTVAEELHFGRAAQRLNIVQPAVSQQIARLERELGVTLLDRSPRHVRLTEPGRRVLDAAREALAAADRVRAAAAGPPTRIRIGSAPGLTGRLERAIDVLRAGNPALEVVLVDLPVPARLAAVRTGELDLALVRGTFTAAGLRVQPAWSEPLQVVLAPGHPVADRPVLTLAELVAYPLRFPARDLDPPLHDAVEAAVRAAGICTLLGRPVGSVPDTIVELGTDPRSWALLPADQVAATGSGRVRGIALDPPVTLAGSVVTPDGAPSACAVALVDAFRDAG